MLADHGCFRALADFLRTGCGLVEINFAPGRDRVEVPRWLPSFDFAPEVGSELVEQCARAQRWRVQVGVQQVGVAGDQLRARALA